MDPTQLLVEIRQLITRAKTEEALRQLLAFVQAADEPAAGWEEVIRQIKSRYYRTVQDQTKAIISYENAQLSLNQVTNDLLEVVEAIMAGRPATPANLANLSSGSVSEMMPSSSPRRVPWVAIGGAAALVLAVILYFVFGRSPEPPGDPTTQEDPTVVEEDPNRCPTYPSNSAFNIMLLPFKPLQGEKKNVESALRDRLATEIEKYEIPASVLIRNIDVMNFNKYPATPRQAERFGRPCHAQLIIFGTTEEGEEGLLTATRFRFLDIDSFKQTQLILNQEAEIDTIRSLSSIAAEGVLSEGIEENIKILFGLIAHESGNDEAAVALISQAADMIEEPLGANWNMVLADSYTNLEDYEQAIRVYDQILAQDSTHQQAWEKRALLNFKLGDYQAAAQDLTVVITQDPKDVDKRVIRGLANARMNKLQEAKQDYEVVEESTTQVKGARTLDQELNTRIRAEEERKQDAESTLRSNPKDTSALRIRAEAAHNLGEYELAGQTAASLLAIDRKNTFAWRTLEDVKPRVADTVAFNATIQRMLRANPRLLQQVKTIPAQQLQIQQ